MDKDEVMTPEQRQEWRKKAEETSAQIDNSRAFFSILDAATKKDPLSLMQLAMAILRDIPVMIAHPINETLPKNMERLARKIVHYDPSVPGDMARATQELMIYAKEEKLFNEEAEPAQDR